MKYGAVRKLCQRLSKGGGGIMAFVNQDFTTKRSCDLKSQEIEAIWLEICPFKSKRSIILGSFYRRHSSNKADDMSIETSIERVHLSNKETLIEIRRSSQIRTLLKLVVVNRT